MKNRDEMIASCISVIIFAVLLSALVTVCVMMLWNWLAPVFWTNAPHLNFLQTMGVMILLYIIGNLLFSHKSK